MCVLCWHWVRNWVGITAFTAFDSFVATMLKKTTIEVEACTKKLLDRINVAPDASPPSPTTALGNWYATALFWKPQVALLVNERTLLPVLMPLAPSSTLVARIPVEVSRVLGMHGANEEFIAAELAEMAEVNITKTANRRVVGTMNEFAFLADTYREDMGTVDLTALSMRLSETPCGALKHQAPDPLLREILGAARWNSGYPPKTTRT